MNLKIVKFSLGKLLIVLAGLLTLPLAISFVYGESSSDKMNFIIPIIIAFVLGFILVKGGIIHLIFIQKRPCLLLPLLGFYFPWLGLFLCFWLNQIITAILMRFLKWCLVLLHREHLLHLMLSFCLIL